MMDSMNIEELGLDPNRKLSSKPLYSRRSKKYGYRKPEALGEWKIFSGYSCYASSDLKAAHGGCASSLLKLGFRIDSISSDGVTDYAIFIPNKNKREIK